jgi:hypothetical protein
MTRPNVYIALVEKLVGPKLPDVADEVLVGSMVLAMVREFGDQPQAVYDCLDRELTAALRVLRDRALVGGLKPAWNNSVL